MPFTFLAHQAPVLPLKLWRPRWFSGAGLVIGSMAPDFEKFVHGLHAGRFAHTRVGLVAYCLPMSLAVYWLLTRVAAPALARYSPNLGRFHLRDYAASLAAAPGGWWWAVVAISALIGAASHVALDGFTHADPRVTALFPFLRERLVSVGGRPVWLPSLLQVGVSLAGGAFVLALMLYMGGRRAALVWRGLEPTAGRLPADRARAAAEYWLVVVLVTTVSSVAVAMIALRPAHWYGHYHAVVAVGIRLPLTGFAAVCVAALVDRVRWPRAAVGRRDRHPAAPPRHGPRTAHRTSDHSSRTRAG